MPSDVTWTLPTESIENKNVHETSASRTTPASLPNHDTASALHGSIPRGGSAPGGPGHWLDIWL
ncbi:hypothetical protein GCM10010195_14420 [Kitasatospora griseola]|nr:hypothetical protein GCM10010195_14420 [Kitasatospora griseola]